MINIILLISCLFFLHTNDDLIEKAELQIKQACGAEVSFSQSKYIIPNDVRKQIEKESQQKFFRNELNYWKIYKLNKLTHVAFLDNVYGKALPITILVVLDLQGKVTHTSIIKYREQYGGGVSNEYWLKQFLGLDSNSDFKIGKEIQGLSGATISANSVSKGIKKITLLFKLRKDEFTN